VTEKPLELPPWVSKGVAMSKANEFQIYANECLAWAKTADTEEKRKQFLGLARTWMQAAVPEERGNASRDDQSYDARGRERS